LFKKIEDDKYFGEKIMPKAPWVRVSPTVLEVLALPPGGTMIMMTAAKKHLTIFRRERRAPGAGRPEVKEAFKKAAAKTRGEPLRSKRNLIIKKEMEKAGLKTGIYYRRSRSKYAPLAGKKYKLAEGETVTAALQTKSLSDILVE